eukprot:503020-Pleurochrysis_carterae.AAC.3
MGQKQISGVIAVAATSTAFYLAACSSHFGYEIPFRLPPPPPPRTPFSPRRCRRAETMHARDIVARIYLIIA